MKAFVLIKFASIETKDAYRLIKRLKPVIESYMVYGRFDAVAIIQANTLEDIRHIILSDIQPIPGVIETMPCLIVEDENRMEPESPAQSLRQTT
jgi:DNA-binding Lrp family transcriptional regulator